MSGAYLVRMLPLSTLLKNESGALNIVRVQHSTIENDLYLRHDSLSQSIMKLYARLDSHHIE
jgi:hypothetical protein